MHNLALRQKFNTLLLLIIIVTALYYHPAYAGTNESSTYWGTCIGSVGSVYNYPSKTCTVTSQNQFVVRISELEYVYCVQKFNCNFDLGPIPIIDNTMRNQYMQETLRRFDINAHLINRNR